MGDIGNAINEGLGNISDAVGITNYGGEKALSAQQRSADAANQTMRGIYEQQRADQEPWRQSGMKALAGLEGNNFMQDWQKDPGYQFRMNEGMKAINANASARGGLNSGATLKALTRYGQDYASSEYDKAYNRNYNRLSSLAGFGNNATNMNNQNAGAYGQSVAGNQIGMGNAAASNQIAQSNRMGQFLGQGIGAAATFFSDLRLKTEIEKISSADLAEMKQYLNPYTYKYIDEKYGKGKWLGVMAQDLEKSKLGKTLVRENENGEKMIDLEKAVSVLFATMAVA